jgi:hypothetical protein
VPVCGEPHFPRGSPGTTGSREDPDFVAVNLDGEHLVTSGLGLQDLSAQSSGLSRMPSNFSPKDELNPYADYSIEQMLVESRDAKP